VVYHDGYYYLAQSNAGSLTVAKSPTITGLGRAKPVAIYAPPRGQPYSYDLWAPELVYLKGQWYIYVAATDAPGNNRSHRMVVLQADSADPQGSWTMKGKIYDPADDKWVIDGAVFEYRERLYMIWSGWPGDTGDFPQNLYIAALRDPFTLDGPGRLISEPDQPWERSVAAIQEGPEAFIHDGQLSIVYSADASWSAAYKLGLLKLTGADPLDASAWTKVGPVLTANPDGGVYGPGHNSTPVQSPDGSESWLIYHAKAKPEDGWGDRAIHAQPFTWNTDGIPDFGQATPKAAALRLPAGELCGLIIETASGVKTQKLEETYTLDNQFVDTGAAFINTLGSFSVAAWVRLDRLDGDYAFVSQDGGFTSHFVLGYSGAHSAFVFNLYGPQGAVLVEIVSDMKPKAGQWYHLVGVRDALRSGVTLYVDASAKGTIYPNEDWDARGHTIIGAARRKVKRVDRLTGTVRGIRLYNGALDGDEVRALYDQTKAE
jgi:GH43 family beta-xylosidase